MAADTPISRRSVLSAVGLGLTGGLFGSAATAVGQTDPTYAVVQGGTCTPVRVFQGDEPVETRYGYHLPEQYVSEENGASAGEPTYASTGTTDLQRTGTSVAFLYRGPNGLSLVFVHGSLDARDAGSVTFRVSGLPSSGRWLVKDDLYRVPATGELAAGNHDRWDVDGTDHRIDWTWGAAGTDGGAFGYLGDAFDVVVEPAFNEAAALYGEHYEGTVEEWAFVSATAEGPTYLSLAMDEPLRIRTGGCGGESKTPVRDDIETDTEAEEATETEREEEGEDDGEEEEPKDERDGERDDETSSVDAASDGDRTVCHRPPGNPDNAHTIEVGSESAVEAHLGHGDTMGQCDGNG